MQPDDKVYTEWLAAAPKGVRWDRAQEMWDEYKRKRKQQAEDVAKRLLGNSDNTNDIFESREFWERLGNGN